MVLHYETVKRFDFIRTYFIQSHGRYGTKQLEHLLGGEVYIHINHTSVRGISVREIIQRQITPWVFIMQYHYAAFQAPHDQS